MNGRVREQMGNRDGEKCPHGIYPCTGKDRWIAIAVEDDHQWQALCAAMERPDLEGHREAGETLDAEIAKWTEGQGGAELESLLQARGVPAHRVLDTPDLYACPQLQHRGHYIDVACEIYQSTTVESSRLHLSESPAKVPEQALSSGRDNRYVLETILGYDPERIAALAEAWVLI